MKKRQLSPYMQLERHKLLKLKLDISSKLLQFPETKPEDECMMTSVTKCLCERYQFEQTCSIKCSNLEAYGLPLNRKLIWNDFRGVLSCSNKNWNKNIILIILLIFLNFYLYYIS
ncbi:hypothetical protein Mgra_00008437 [Meloidogyne graminicola]|uniref:Uncharacterized protein n=1 Tax=Meloidogyne graminicola TaxID=189291 RepID=A0A8S9ZFT7_9BILA|nr:hypothetical protein Mgra_00008437 [Meloidogyne graminicola]